MSHKINVEPLFEARSKLTGFDAYTLYCTVPYMILLLERQVNTYLHYLHI